MLEVPDLYRCLVDAPPDRPFDQQSDRVGLVLLPGGEAGIAAGKRLYLGASEQEVGLLRSRLET